MGFLTFAPEVMPEALSLGFDPSMNWPTWAVRLGLAVHPLLLKVLVVLYLAMWLVLLDSHTYPSMPDFFLVSPPFIRMGLACDSAAQVPWA